MSDPLDQVLRLVAEGRLTAEEAAPILDALQATGQVGDTPADDSTTADEPAGPTSSGGRPRALRIMVLENGRKAVNLRVPLSLGRMGLDRIPGLSPDDISDIRQALDQGLTGPILAVDDDGDGNGVRIVLE
jgi:SHOCT-like protein